MSEFIEPTDDASSPLPDGQVPEPERAELAAPELCADVEALGGNAQTATGEAALVDAARGEESGEAQFLVIERTPNFGHLAIVVTICTVAGFITMLLTGLALHLHVFGVSTVERASGDIRYALGTQLFFYVLAFSGCLVIFPRLWLMSFFTGLHWNSAVVAQRKRLLLAAVFVCFTAAMLDSALMPQAKNAPIDALFRLPGAPWLLFVFGVTVAPFFEEMAFRGFLLPALATAVDWMYENVTHRPAQFLDAELNPQWSWGAKCVAAILTSIPFAYMHAPQNAGAMGSFVLMIVVSLVLCAVRLTTRSLAASTLVHAVYNLVLFLLMVIGTHGFTKMENL